MNVQVLRNRKCSKKDRTMVLFLLVVLCILFLLGFASAEIVGKNSEGSSSDYWALRMVSTLFQSSVNGSACNITALMDVGAGDSPRMRFFVYAQNQTLLSSSAQHNFSSSAYPKSNFTLNLSSCVSIVSGNWYWLGWTADANIRYYFDDVAGVNSSTYYRYYDGALPDPADFYSGSATQNSTIWLDVSGATTTTTTTVEATTTTEVTTTTTTTEVTTTTSSSTTSSSGSTTTSTSSGVSSTTLGCCAVSIKSSSALPVENAFAEVRNISSGVLLGSNYSDSLGVVYWNMSCEDLNWSITYPLSAYSAAIQNFTVSNQTYLNSYVSGCVQLVNTLGEYLEGQDASVVAYVANTSVLVHDFKTQCVMKPQLVCHGSEGCNYESVSDCSFTDSQGWYCFKGLVTETEGFEFNGYYDLTFTINAKQARLPFHVVNEKPTDWQKTEDWIRNNGGTIILMILGSLAAAGFAGLLFWIARGGKGKARNKGF